MTVPRSVLLACLLLPLSWTAPAVAADPPSWRSAQQILDASPASDWRTPDPANLLYMELDAGRVVIELAPGFAPEHVANIRTLAGEGFWDGTSIYRVQDNFVAQFGDADAGEPAKAKDLGSARRKLPAEFQRDATGLAFDPLPDADGWAPQAGFADGFAAARDPAAGQAWMAHCYGVVGAGRDMAADSSIGAELYVVIGQAPRQLDRNITQVGRVLQGMELLSALPRGPEPMGFYEKPEQRAPIVSVKLASDVPVAERTPLQVLRTDSKTFAAATEARRNRRDGWYVRPAGHIDLCNVPLPVREAKR